jgi:hypothetical protein
MLHRGLFNWMQDGLGILRMISTAEASLLIANHTSLH